MSALPASCPALRPRSLVQGSGGDAERLREGERVRPSFLFLCAGFSKQMVQILNTHNVQFSSFDVFSDEEVRQGLKTYSSWPTYPQLYVSGELIGGLDIVKVRLGGGVCNGRRVCGFLALSKGRRKFLQVSAHTSTSGANARWF